MLLAGLAMLALSAAAAAMVALTQSGSQQREADERDREDERCELAGPTVVRDTGTRVRCGGGTPHNSATSAPLLTRGC